MSKKFIHNDQMECCKSNQKKRSEYEKIGQELCRIYKNSIVD